MKRQRFLVNVGRIVHAEVPQVKVNKYVVYDRLGQHHAIHNNCALGVD
jgi:hypothetical protein